LVVATAVGKSQIPKSQIPKKSQIPEYPNLKKVSADAGAGEPPGGDMFRRVAMDGDRARQRMCRSGGGVVFGISDFEIWDFFGIWVFEIWDF
jgi:hypothetical protein